MYIIVAFLPGNHIRPNIKRNDNNANNNNNNNAKNKNDIARIISIRMDYNTSNNNNNTTIITIRLD